MTEIYNNEIDVYNKALNDLKEEINNEYYDGGYGTYHDVEMIVRMIEKLMKHGE